jgi:ribosomal protein S5
MTGAMPRVTAPWRKVTVPVAVEGAIEAVSETLPPAIEGFGVVFSVVVVIVKMGVTTWAKDAEVLGASAASPV